MALPFPQAPLCRRSPEATSLDLITYLEAEVRFVLLRKRQR